MSEEDTKLPEKGEFCPLRRMKKPGLPYRLVHRVFGPLAKLPGFSCRSYTQICAGKKDCVLTFGQRLELATHWLLCGVCRSFSKQIDVIDEISASLPAEGSEGVSDGKTALKEGDCLNAEERTQLIKELAEKCSEDER